MHNISEIINNTNSSYSLMTPSPPPLAPQPPPPSTTAATSHPTKTIINIDDSCERIDSASNCMIPIVNLMNDIDSGNDAKEEAINLEEKAIEMNMRMIRKGREEITEITRRSKLDRSKDDIKRRKLLKLSVKLLDKERKEGEQVATVFCITNNGKYLIGNEKLTSPECLELVMDYYSDDNDNDE